MQQYDYQNDLNLSNLHNSHHIFYVNELFQKLRTFPIEGN